MDGKNFLPAAQARGKLRVPGQEEQQWPRAGSGHALAATWLEGAATEPLCSPGTGAAPAALTLRPEGIFVKYCDAIRNPLVYSQ